MEIGAQRRNKFVIERFQVAMGGAQERLFKAPDVFAAHAKLGELKSKQLQKVSNSGEHRHRLNMDVLARDNGGNEAIASHKILNEGCILRKMSLQLCKRKIRGSFQRGVFPLMRRELAESPQ